MSGAVQICCPCDNPTLLESSLLNLSISACTALQDRSSARLAGCHSSADSQTRLRHLNRLSKKSQQSSPTPYPKRTLPIHSLTRSICSRPARAHLLLARLLFTFRAESHATSYCVKQLNTPPPPARSSHRLHYGSTDSAMHLHRTTTAASKSDHILAHPRLPHPVTKQALNLQEHGVDSFHAIPLGERTTRQHIVWTLPKWWLFFFLYRYYLNSVNINKYMYMLWWLTRGAGLQK